MEELAELGFEGVDKFADKYHDKVYDHLPAWKQRQQREDQRRKEQGQPQQQRQDDRTLPANGHRRQRSDSAIEENADAHREDRDMASYANSYAPSGRQDYRDERDARVDRFNQSQAPSPPGGHGYDNTQHEVGYADRGRPTPHRQRSTSWSPPRTERRDDGSRRRRRSRSKSKDGDRTGVRDGDSTRRLAATLVGGLVGGFAGNQVRKGKKFDTAATIGGAILGGIASRELAERVGHKHEERREKRDEQQGAWEQRYGDDHRDRDRDRDRDDRRRRRDSRG